MFIFIYIYLYHSSIYSFSGSLINLHLAASFLLIFFFVILFKTYKLRAKNFQEFLLFILKNFLLVAFSVRLSTKSACRTYHIQKRRCATARRCVVVVVAAAANHSASFTTNNRNLTRIQFLLHGKVQNGGDSSVRVDNKKLKNKTKRTKCFFASAAAVDALTLLLSMFSHWVRV